MQDNNKIDFDVKEQTRLVISIAIIATAASLMDIADPTNQIVRFARGLIIMPAVGSFLYLIMTGSYLKYSRQGEIGEFITPVRFRRGVFDWTINVFWILTYNLILFSIWNLASKNNVPSPWDFIIGVILSIIVAGFFLVVGLKYYNAEQRANKAKEVQRQ